MVVARNVIMPGVKILVMNYGFAGGFLPDVVGTSLHIVANTHMVIGGY